MSECKHIRDGSGPGRSCGARWRVDWLEAESASRPFERQFKEFTGDIRADKTVVAWQA
jgi:hypothetical protein